MEFSEKEISEIKKFVIHLNSQKDSVVVVEGKRDSNCTKEIGFFRENPRIS